MLIVMIQVISATRPPAIARWTALSVAIVSVKQVRVIPAVQATVLGQKQPCVVKLAVQMDQWVTLCANPVVLLTIDIAGQTVNLVVQPGSATAQVIVVATLIVVMACHLERGFAITTTV